MPNKSTHRMRSRKRGRFFIPQQRWQHASICAVCNGHFSPFRQRHHCRNCGISVCGSHSRKRAQIPSSLATAKQRVCDSCYQIIRAEQLHVQNPDFLHAHLAKRTVSYTFNQESSEGHGTHAARPGTVPGATHPPIKIDGNSMPAYSSQRDRRSSDASILAVPIPIPTLHKSKQARAKPNDEERQKKHEQRAHRKPKKQPQLSPKMRVPTRFRGANAKKSMRAADSYQNPAKDQENFFISHDSISLDPPPVREKRKRKEKPRERRDTIFSVCDDDVDAITRRLLSSQRTSASVVPPQQIHTEQNRLRRSDTAPCAITNTDIAAHSEASIENRAPSDLEAEVAVYSNVPVEDGSDSETVLEERDYEMMDKVLRLEQKSVQSQIECHYFYHKWHCIRAKKVSVLQSAERIVRALQHIRKARKYVECTISNAREHIEYEEYQAAILELLRVVAIERSNAVAWYLLAVCRMNVEDHADAEIACRTSLSFEIAPASLILLGRIRMNQGDPDEAIQCYSQALSY